MISAIEITILIIIIQIIYGLINNYIFKNKIKFLEENDRKNKEILNSLESIITENNSKNAKVFEKIEMMEENERKNKEQPKESVEFARGMIIAWIPPQYIKKNNNVYGDIDTRTITKNQIRPPAPIGWAYCDGKNGTPDLRCRYLVGMGHDDQRTMMDLKHIFNDSYDEFKDAVDYAEKNNCESAVKHLKSENIKDPKNYPHLIYNNIYSESINYIVGCDYNKSAYETNSHVEIPCDHIVWNDDISLPISADARDGGIHECIYLNSRNKHLRTAVYYLMKL